jgi:hypothetical protein
MHGRATELMALIGDRELIIEFFAVFSRFECALIRSGFWREAGRHPDKYPAVNMKEFGELIAVDFANVTSEEFRSACRCLKNAKIERQKIKGGKIVWDPRRDDDVQEAVLVLDVVKTIRNNLFHGGKYPEGPKPEGPLFDVSRNNELFNSSLVVIEKCIKMNDKVSMYFEDRA